jgi:hypothetical protein
MAVLLIAAAFWPGDRRPHAPQIPASAEAGTAAYLTRLEASGFQPLPDGEIRVVRSGEQR